MSNKFLKSTYHSINLLFARNRLSKLNNVSKNLIYLTINNPARNICSVKMEKTHLMGENEFKLIFFETPIFYNNKNELKDFLIKCEVLENNSLKWNVSFFKDPIKLPFPISDAGVVMKYGRMTQLSVRTDLPKCTVKLTIYKLNDYEMTAKEECAYAYAHLCTSDTGTLALSVVSTKGNLIAIWNIHYLKITSYFSQSKQPPQLRNEFIIPDHAFIGHRGHGKTFSLDGKRNSAYLENTIEGMKIAYDKGICIVEFDVQLSKDKIPVIYHDFKTRLLTPHSKVQIPVQELMYEDMIINQFQLERDSINKYDNSFYNDDKTKLFAKLEHLFKELPEDLCFDVEIKYAVVYSGGVKEEDLNPLVDKNEYVDAILNVCFEFVGNRKIIFSSFDPDICSILKAKQNSFPVALISDGVSEINYDNKFAQTLEMGVAFGAVEKLYAVVFHSTPIIKEKKYLIKHAHDLGLKMFTWGGKNNTKEAILIQQQECVDAIALDNIDLVKI